MMTPPIPFIVYVARYLRIYKIYERENKGIEQVR